MSMVAGLLILVPCLLIFHNLCDRNASFMNLNKVFKEHFGLFKKCKYQYVIFYVYPILVSVGICFYFTPKASFMEQFNVVVSILLSALLAIMSILISKDFSGLADDARNNAKAILCETNNAIIFDVSIGIMLIIVNLVLFTIDVENTLWAKVIAGISYYLFIVMLLTILLIIKRLSRLSDL